MSLLAFDPAEKVNQIVVIIVMVLLLVFMVRYKENVMLFLTGDTHLHGSFLDLVWCTCFQCCGTCNGDWTRIATRYCCCCCSSLKRKNLVNVIGRAVGLANKPVTVKNIVVGDIPFFSGRGDFFLEVECSSNPKMVTSVAEGAHPKVVHFPEVFTLRMRENWLERNVRFSICELNVWGQNTIAEVFVPAESVIRWAEGGKNEVDRRFRFAMTPTDRNGEFATPCWICVEFESEPDVRELDQLHGNYTEVRMYETSTQHWKPADMQDFKTMYALVDTSGAPTEEPDEGGLECIQLMHFVNNVIFGCLQFLAVFVGFFFLFFRMYLWSCYRQYYTLTIAKLKGKTFPVSTVEQADLRDECDDEYVGTGADDGTTACRPLDNETEYMCEHMAIEQPEQPKPEAFVLALHEYLDISISHGVPCKPELCSVRNKIAPLDWLFYSVLVLCFFSTWICKWTTRCVIQRRHRKLVAEQARKMRDARKKINPSNQHTLW